MAEKIEMTERQRRDLLDHFRTAQIVEDTFMPMNESGSRYALRVKFPEDGGKACTVLARGLSFWDLTDEEVSTLSEYAGKHS